MKGLRTLDLTGTKASPDAVAELKKALPECKAKSE